MQASEINEDPCQFAKIVEPPPPPEEPPTLMALLPPDHPLLSKFQKSLQEHLLRTKQKLENEINELQFQVKNKEQRREEEGLSLYEMQQRIVSQADNIKEITANIEEETKKRIQEQEEVTNLKAELEQKVKLTKEEKILYKKRLAELEGLQLLGSNIKKWALEVEDEVKNAKRIASRDAQLQKQLSEEKRKSDILFYRLDMEVKKREAELQNIIEEEEAMKQVVGLLNMSISDANTDLEALQNEHKRLNQAWGEVIIAIQLRDKILHQVNENLRKEKESIKLNTTGIEAIKKQIVKEMELNRKLEVFRQRMADDYNSLKRECQKEADVLSALQNKLDELPEWLARTENDLQEATREGTRLQNEIRKLNFRLNKKHNAKFQIEQTILTLAQDQLITNKASSYRLKLLRKSQENRRKMDVSLAQAQNQLAVAMLDVEKLRGQVFKLEQEGNRMQGIVDNAEKKCDNLEVQLKKMQDQIELKMKRFDRLNQQLDEAMKTFDEVAGSPTELKIKQIEKSIQTAEQQIREHQQFWIMLQNHFVNMSQKRNEQLNEIQVTRKQLSIIKQKSLKIDQDLEVSETRTKELKLNIQRYTSKQEILNDKIFKKRNQHENESSGFELEQFEITEKLKESEMRILGLESEIDELLVEIELNKDLVLDMHRESLSWETKYKLIEETIRWAKDERSLDSEISAMKTEIHRMNIRYNQLKRAQEKLVQDLEHCVMHREQIFVVASVRDRVESTNMGGKGLSQSQFKANELRSKIKAVKTEIIDLKDERISGLSRKVEYIVLMLKKLQDDLQSIDQNHTKMKAEIEEGRSQVHNNLEQIIRKQRRAKAYQKLHGGAMSSKLSRSEAKIELEIQKQMEINESLVEIIQQLTADYPEKKLFFTFVSHICQS